VSSVEPTGPLLALARAVTDAVDAAARADGPGFDAATRRLVERHDAEHVRRLLAAAVRPLLEDAHPDGVDGDDLAAVLDGCAQGTAPWWPGVEPVALAVVLTGAFGVQVATREELPVRLDDADVVRHAVLLLDQLLRGAGRPLRPVLAAAFGRLAVEDTGGGW
jgi:hypothetical protein